MEANPTWRGWGLEERLRKDMETRTPSRAREEPSDTVRDQPMAWVQLDHLRGSLCPFPWPVGG